MKIIFIYLFTLAVVIKTTVIELKSKDKIDFVEELDPCSDLGFTFFNQQQFTWGFGIQNSTNNTVDNWEVRITNANYQLDPTQLTNQSAFVYTEVANPNGTFNLTLTGTSSIAPFSGIPGGNIEWQGVNFGQKISSDDISIFCGELPSVTIITNRRITYRVKGN